MESRSFQPADWLVQTKLNPPQPRPDTLLRPRMAASLRSAVTAYPLTLLSAPAGSGKTTILASLRTVVPEYPLAWLSLDEEDNDPARFLAALVTALQRLHPAVGQRAWPLLQGAVSADWASRSRRVMGALINDVLEYLPEPFLVVLDDLHVITEPSIYLALEYLLDHHPWQMHLAVGTRYDPPLPLARLAARRQLVELRRAELAFTPAEAGQLLNDILGLNLTDADLAGLLAHTEGWAAGLCLLATSLTGDAPPTRKQEFLAGISQTERHLFDFLAEEVLRSQAPDVREFLLQTSILAELTPAVCRAVTRRDDAHELLEELYRRNLFLVSIESPEGNIEAYRYHALFARFLGRQLSRQFPDLVPELHRRAAEVQVTPGRAVSHYLAAGLWQQAAQIMAESGRELLSHGMFETLCSWYAALPEPVRAAHPLLLLLRGQGEIHRGAYSAAEGFLSRAQAALAEAGDTAGEGAAVCSLMTVAVQGGDFDRVRLLAERADALPLPPQGRAIAHMNRTWLNLLDRDWTQAALNLQAALAVTLESRDLMAGISVVAYMSALIAAVPGCSAALERFCMEFGEGVPPGSPVRLGLDEMRTYLALWRGELSEAHAVGEGADALRQQLVGYPTIGPDLAAVLATIHCACGEPEAALRQVEILLERTKAAPGFQLPFWLHAAGRTLCLLGKLEPARSVYERLRAVSPDFAFTAFLQDHLGGLLAMAEGDWPAAEALLLAAARLESSVPVVAAAGSATLLLARVRQEQQRPAEALALLESALAAFEAEGMPGRVLLEGDMVMPTLRLAASQGDQRAARALALFGNGPEAPAPAAPSKDLFELLTPREVDVLRLIAAGSSNREIAGTLFVSEQTVKTHVIHILRKLDVSTRTQAALRGREMGICANE